ncbi:MAG TPA: biotin/lipoyl-containing protein [Bacillus sp. (in: firmicutes)]|uniref:biotin/lipoyl-containing protein n=1 Tax=Bacillus litorisediminis TaxID=2922713 RepID=UPI001FAE5295|nr:biotin/lipoyl-containing protein [Bacillus litorisediminis]HWO77426.1 biotin/lipoyl-containing protein [Bacillus sp. (in: firmicutes)]
MQVTATMAGTVLTVLVEKDEMIKEGQEVIMIESMKMEIPIESTGAGKVKEVHVQAGDFVNEGDVLITIE